MNTKNLLVSLFAIASVLLLASSINALPIASTVDIKVNNMAAASYNSTDLILASYAPAVVAGERATVEVSFVAAQNDHEVTIEVELEGDGRDTQASSMVFDVELGKSYNKVVSVEVPFELDDNVSDDLVLNVKIDGTDYQLKLDEIVLRVQRPTYNPELKSVILPQSVDAGENFPVDVVLQNMGYNDLDNLYVTISISALGVERTAYFGDLVPIEDCSDNDCNKEDTTTGRLYVELPFAVEAGVYTVDVTVKNDDVTLKKSTQLNVANSVPNTVIASVTKQTVNAGENAEYTLLIVNPTNTVQVYTIVSESASGFSTSLSDTVLAIPAGSSQSVKVLASSTSAGTYNFNVNVFAGEKLSDTKAFTLEVKNGGNTNFSDPIIVLTVVLAIIFIVLLVVLIVLVGKKPKKSEEFGESYY